jgi:signal transduction histidine kinase
MHAENSHEGCGSTEYCTVCGFANAIASSENNLEDQRECNILTNKGKALTLNVTTRPFKMNGLNYVFCAVEDISDKKMIVNLDRIFLHDITNTAGSIYSAIEIADNFDFDQLRALIKNQSKRLLDEINSHRILLTAESDDLRTKVAETNIEPLINEIISGLISGIRFRDFIINTNIEDGILFTDSTLLSRVIQNLIKNALEASPKHLPIEVSAKISSKNELVLMVKNQTVIPREIQLKIFQRSFSTKGVGRGFGTYSIKLLTEKYLNGNVSFVSEDGTGTVFTIKVPSQKPDGVII